MSGEGKTLSFEEFRSVYVENATFEWLKRNGLDPSSLDTPAVELDESVEDSQISAWKTNAEEAFDFFFDVLNQVTAQGYDISFSPADEVQSDELEGVSRLSSDTSSSGAVQRRGAFFVFLKAKSDVAMHVSDVREWLAEVDALGVPDSTEVDGELYLDYDVDFVATERSECLYCGNEDDVLVTVHECPAGYEEMQPTLFDAGGESQ